MTTHELFEAHFSDMHDCEPEHIKKYRMINGSYSKADIATAFRYFSAGFEADQGEKMHVIGYLTQKSSKSGGKGVLVVLHDKPSGTASTAVYAKQCEPLKLEMKHEKQ